MNEVFETATFSELFYSLERNEQRWIEKVKRQLEINLFAGKPLRFSWFREKKMMSNRLYYFVNFNTRKAVLVAFGHKKEQQSIINHLLLRKDEYLRIIQ